MLKTYFAYRLAIILMILGGGTSPAIASEGRGQNSPASTIKPPTLNDGGKRGQFNRDSSEYQKTDNWVQPPRENSGRGRDILEPRSDQYYSDDNTELAKALTFEYGKLPLNNPNARRPEQFMPNPYLSDFSKSFPPDFSAYPPPIIINNPVPIPTPAPTPPVPSSTPTPLPPKSEAFTEALGCPVGGDKSIPEGVKCIEPRVKRLEDGLNFALRVTERMVNDSMNMPDQRPLIMRLREQIYDIYARMEHLNKPKESKHESKPDKGNTPTLPTPPTQDTSGNLRNETYYYLNGLRGELYSSLSRLRTELGDQSEALQGQVDENTNMIRFLINQLINIDKGLNGLGLNLEDLRDRLADLNEVLMGKILTIREALEEKIKKESKDLESKLKKVSTKLTLQIRELEVSFNARLDDLAKHFENRMADYFGDLDSRLGKVQNQLADLKENIAQKLGDIDAQNQALSQKNQSQEILVNRILVLEDHIDGIQGLLDRVLQPTDAGPAIGKLLQDLGKLKQRVEKNKLHLEFLTKTNQNTRQKMPESGPDLEKLRHRLDDMERDFFNNVRKAAYDIIQGEMMKYEHRYREEIASLRTEMNRLKGNMPSSNSNQGHSGMSFSTADLQHITGKLQSLEGRLHSLENQKGGNSGHPQLPPPPSDDEKPDLHSGNTELIQSLLERIKDLEKTHGKSYDDSELRKDIDEIWEVIDKLGKAVESKGTTAPHPTPSKPYDDSELRDAVDELGKAIDDIKENMKSFDNKDTSSIQEIKHTLVILEKKMNTLQTATAPKLPDPEVTGKDMEQIQEEIEDIKSRLDDIKDPIVPHELPGGKIDVTALKEEIEEKLIKRFTTLIESKDPGVTSQTLHTAIQEALADFKKQVLSLIDISKQDLEGKDGSKVEKLTQAINTFTQEFEKKLEDLRKIVLDKPQEEKSNEKILEEVKTFINGALKTWKEENLDKIASLVNEIEGKVEKEQKRGEDHEERLKALENLVKELQHKPTPTPEKKVEIISTPSSHQSPTPLEVGTIEWKDHIRAVCQVEAEQETTDKHCPDLYGTLSERGFTPAQCKERSNLGNESDAVLASQTHAMFIACKEERLKNPNTLPKPEDRMEWKKMLSPSFEERLKLKNQRQQDIQQVTTARTNLTETPQEGNTTPSLPLSSQSPSKKVVIPQIFAKPQEISIQPPQEGSLPQGTGIPQKGPTIIPPPIVGSSGGG